MKDVIKDKENMKRDWKVKLYNIMIIKKKIMYLNRNNKLYIPKLKSFKWKIKSLLIHNGLSAKVTSITRFNANWWI